MTCGAGQAVSQTGAGAQTAFLWQPRFGILIFGILKQHFFRAGGQTGCGAQTGTGSQTTTGGGQACFFLWQASAVPKLPSKPAKPRRAIER